MILIYADNTQSINLKLGQSSKGYVTISKYVTKYIFLRDQFPREY